MTCRELATVLDYHGIPWHLELIAEPARGACQRLYTEFRDRFEQAPGSTANHQAWPGGYVDHVTEVLNYARHLYALHAAIGRPLPFTLSDALTVLFVHDLEKPFRLSQDSRGVIRNEAALASKADSRAFREDLLARFQLTLSPAQQNALRYVEGEGADYSRTHRTMNELAAFCHQADVWSARQYPDYPKSEGDEWPGAGRMRAGD